MKEMDTSTKLFASRSLIRERYSQVFRQSQLKLSQLRCNMGLKISHV